MWEEVEKIKAVEAEKAVPERQAETSIEYAEHQQVSALDVAAEAADFEERKRVSEESDAARIEELRAKFGLTDPGTAESVVFPEKPEETATAQESDIGPDQTEEIISKQNETMEDSEIKKEIQFKIEKIRKWAEENGFKEGQDFRVIESITDVDPDTANIAPHERRQFFLAVQTGQYGKFRDYFGGQYVQERDEELQNPWQKAKVNYSWGGRFAVGGDGRTFFDTVDIPDVSGDIKNMETPTHHSDFKEFFRNKTGFEFPSAMTLNPRLKEMSTKSIDQYREALQKLKDLEEKNKTAEEENKVWGLEHHMSGLSHAIMVLEDAEKGEALEDMPDTIKGVMGAKVRHYADLTYNAEDIVDLDKVAQLSGVTIPEDARIDRIFESYGMDRRQMDEICKEFSEMRIPKSEKPEQ